MSTMITTTMRTHLWFETPKGMFFGMGRVLLLQKVKELGSLNKAAKELGMSYRAAWGKIKATEEVLGKPLLVKVAGRKGFVLSDMADTLVNNFCAWQQEVETYALQRAQEKFSWKINEFSNAR
jgi:molybdate transport system regulatory protein